MLGSSTQYGASRVRPVEPLILDLLEWIGPRSRPYAEVLEAWRTSCPRLPVWEEANARGFASNLSTSQGVRRWSSSRRWAWHIWRRGVRAPVANGVQTSAPMQANVLPILGALLVLLAVAGIARYFAASVRQRNTLSVILVVLGLVTAFFFFFGAGSWLRDHRARPRPHAGIAGHHSVALPASALRVRSRNVGQTQRLSGMQAASVILAPVESPAQRDAARSLVSEYLRWVGDIARSNYGLSFDVDAMVQSDIEDRSKFYPPLGRFYLVQHAGRFVGVGCLKRLAPTVGECSECTCSPMSGASVPAARLSSAC